MNDRDAERLNKFIRGVESTLTNHEKRISECQQKIQYASRQAASQTGQSTVDKTVEELKRDTAHYTQVVMLAGYAGFFTLWTQTRNEMSLWLFASTGALISTSLFVFVVFELYKAWALGRLFSRKPPFHVDDVNNAIASANKYWHPAFLVSSITGLVSGISLLAWFVYKSVVAAGHIVGAA